MQKGMSSGGVGASDRLEIPMTWDSFYHSGRRTWFDGESDGYKVGERSMDDKEQIRRTIAEFCQYLDEPRFEEWSALIGEDATFQQVK
jgi:hypothetical protein